MVPRRSASQCDKLWLEMQERLAEVVKITPQMPVHCAKEKIVCVPVLRTSERNVEHIEDVPVLQIQEYSVDVVKGI